MGMEYLYIYSAASEFIEDYYGEEYHEPWVSVTIETEEVNYNKKGRDRLLVTPLTFKTLVDGELSVQNSNGSYPRDFEYSLNGGEWTEFSLPKSSGKLLITALTAGDEISFRRDNDNFAGARFVGDETLKINIYGNLMSMQYGSGFSGQTEIRNLTKGEVFANLFYGIGVVDATELLLPSMNLASKCYMGMFSGCTSLMYGPELPATGLSTDCYSHMFYNCNNLREVPELPATTLAGHCYEEMFNRCGRLTEIHELPAMEMTENCYHCMFQYCSGLTVIPINALPATTLATSCYGAMFMNCTNITTAPALPATTLTQSCYSGMFNGCTNLATAPQLPATTLANNCYQLMFRDCISLTAAPELLAPQLIDYCYNEMFRGCRNLAYVKCTTINWNYNSSVSNWLNGVSANGTFVKAAGVSWNSGTSGIPNGWTVIEEA